MSLVVKLMIGGWITTFAMIGFFALKESGKLIKIRKRMALWLESSAPPVVSTSQASLEHEGQDVA
jgi:hypothetical protein